MVLARLPAGGLIGSAAGHAPVRVPVIATSSNRPLVLSRPQLPAVAYDRAGVTCHAVASSTMTRPAPATIQESNLPRGETFGATMSVEKVTIQAGDRDLLTVSASLVQLGGVIAPSRDIKSYINIRMGVIGEATGAARRVLHAMLLGLPDCRP